MKESIAVFEKRLQVVRELVDNTNKQSVIIIQQHPGREDDYMHFPPVRESISNIIAFAEVSNPVQVEEVLKVSSNRIDRFILDTDKKRLNSSEIIEKVKSYPLVSKLLFYSDFDVWGQAAVDFITEIEGNIQGKDILVYGQNYLTARVVRKLLTMGANVYVQQRGGDVRRFPLDKESVVLFESEKLRIADPNQNEFDIIIGGEVLNEAESVSSIIHAKSIFDIGIGNFSKEYIAESYKCGSMVYRFDNRAGISSIVLGLMETDYLICNNMGSVQIGNINVVSGGILSEENAIIVDNAYAPSFVFGVADGRGKFKKELSQRNLEDLKVIKSLIN